MELSMNTMPASNCAPLFTIDRAAEHGFGVGETPDPHAKFCATVSLAPQLYGVRGTSFPRFLTSVSIPYVADTVEFWRSASAYIPQQKVARVVLLFRHHPMTP